MRARTDLAAANVVRALLEGMKDREMEAVKKLVGPDDLAKSPPPRKPDAAVSREGRPAPRTDP